MSSGGSLTNPFSSWRGVCLNDSDANRQSGISSQLGHDISKYHGNAHAMTEVHTKFCVCVTVDFPAMGLPRCPWGDGERRGVGKTRGGAKLEGRRRGTYGVAATKSPEKDRLQVDESLTSGLSPPPLPLHRVPAPAAALPQLPSSLTVGAVCHWLEVELESRSTKMTSANYTRTLGGAGGGVCGDRRTIVRSRQRR